MAIAATELSLESIRNFMLYHGGRVTNHELVHHFKNFLTNTETKELARDQFKQYVNTLSLVVKENNNKYLVLKKKYRGEAPLDSILRTPDTRSAQPSDHNYNPSNQNHAQISSDFGASPHQGRGHMVHQHSQEGLPERTHPVMNDTNPFVNYQPNDQSSVYSPHQYPSRDSSSSFSGSSPTHHGHGPQDFTAPPLPPRQASNQSPFNGGPPATRLRTPPPYRPPPPPPESPILDNFSPPYSHHDVNRFPAPPHHANQKMNPQHHQSAAKDYRSPEQYQKDHRRASYEAHSEEDFRNLNRSTSFTEPADLGIPIPQNFQPSPQHAHSHHNVALLSKPSGHRQPPPPTDGMLQSRPMKPKSGSPSSDISQTSSDDSAERRTVDMGKLHKQRGNDHNKENFGPHSNSKFPRQGSLSSTSEDSESMAVSGPGEREKKISVKEKTQIFNRMASETSLNEKAHKNGSKSNRSSRAEKEYDDSISIMSYGQDGQDWLVAAASSDFNEILRLLKAHPELMRRKDRHNGYTALHWAAKHGRVEVVKLLAGTHQADPNARSNGGYTPLHLAAMFNRQDVFDLLVHYGSDLNLRDYSGKKPRQYNTIASSTISPEHHKRIVQRRNSIKDSASFLRIGSLNVKVRRTTEAFNALLSRDSAASDPLRHLHKNYGSSDSLPEEREPSSNSSSKLMPPPIFGPMKKRKIKKERSDNNLYSSSSSSSSTAPSRPISSPLLSSLSSSLASLSSSSLTSSSTTSKTKDWGLSSSAVASHNPASHQPIANDSDSDNACGFGSDWQ